MLQYDFLFWTPNSMIPVVTAIVGLILWIIGEQMEGSVFNRILTEGVGGLPGLDHIIYRKTRFSNWCWNKRELEVRKYDNIVFLLKNLGASMLAGGLLVYLGQFNIGIALGLAILIFCMFTSRDTNIAEYAEKELRTWHSGVVSLDESENKK